MPGIDSFTKLCLHCDGADATVLFPDASTASPKTLTANGNAQVDTAQSKFGGASALFDGAGDYISSPDHADFDLGAGDFTIDFWMRFNSHASGYQTWIGQANIGAASNMGWSVEFNDYVTSPLFTFTTNGTTLINFTGGIPTASWVDGTWYHIAVVRSGNVGKIFVNGSQVGSDYNFTGVTIFNSSAPLRIGSRDSGNDFNGWLDEVRISKGVARWTSNFTPPTAPYDTTGGPSYTDTPSGGIVLGGSQTNLRTLALAQSSGLVLGGSITDTLLLALTPSAGIVLGGSVALTKTYANAPSAGIVLNGTCTSVTFAGYSDAPSGGIALGGSAAVVYTQPLVPSAGIVLGGSQTNTRTLALARSGGLVLNGTCSSSITTAPAYVVAPSGGIVLGGSAFILTETYPISDLLDGTWTDQAGGTNLWDAIDEAVVNDADYIKSAASPNPSADICEVSLMPINDPQLSTGHALIYRYGSDADGWTTVTQVLTGPQADAISNYSQLSVRFEAVS